MKEVKEGAGKWRVKGRGKIRVKVKGKNLRREEN